MDDAIPEVTLLLTTGRQNSGSYRRTMAELGAGMRTEPLPSHWVNPAAFFSFGLQFVFVFPPCSPGYSVFRMQSGL